MTWGPWKSNIVHGDRGSNKARRSTSETTEQNSRSCMENFAHVILHDDLAIWAQFETMQRLRLAKRYSWYSCCSHPPQIDKGKRLDEQSHLYDSIRLYRLCLDRLRMEDHRSIWHEDAYSINTYHIVAESSTKSYKIKLQNQVSGISGVSGSWRDWEALSFSLSATWSATALSIMHPKTWTSTWTVCSCLFPPCDARSSGIQNERTNAQGLPGWLP